MLNSEIEQQIEIQLQPKYAHLIINLMYLHDHFHMAHI